MTPLYPQKLVLASLTGGGRSVGQGPVGLQRHWKYEVILYTYPPMKIEQRERSETSTYKIQPLGNYPEESMQHAEHCESLGIENNRNLYMAYIDYRKALDSVPHSSLIQLTQIRKTDPHII